MLKISKFFLICFTVFSFFAFFSVSIVLADSTGKATAPTDSTGKATAVDTGGCTGDTCTLPNPLAASGATSPEALIGVIVKGVLGVVGAVALLMFIWGGFLWLTAAGSPERVKKGQQVIVWATLGLGVIFTSYALVRFVLQSLGA